MVGAAALWGVLLVWLFVGISSEGPDPTEPSGDPCCDVPDTWGQVAEGAAWSAGAAVVDGLLFATATSLISWALRSRWPRRRTLVAIPVAEATLAVAAIALAHALSG